MADKGKSIEGFAIIRLIGQGGMGRVIKYQQFRFTKL